MFPTAIRLSKASRAPLTPKRGGKQYYKGTRQAFLPGGPRTGAPGRHVVRGKAKYRLIDEKVRVFVAPPLEEILLCPLRPYVAVGKKLSSDQEISLFGKYRGPLGLTPEHFLRVAREHTYAIANPEAPYRNPEPPSWMSAQKRLGLYGKNETGIALKEDKPVQSANSTPQNQGKVLRELEIVTSKETTIAPASYPSS